MKIIAIQDIIDCNQMLKEKELAFKVHIRDACGKAGNCSIRICIRLWMLFSGKEDVRYHLVKTRLIFGWAEEFFCIFLSTLVLWMR